MATPKEPGTSARLIIATLASSYGLQHRITPLADAPLDTQRATSDLAPLISETTGKRYWLIERMTLRAYADVIEEAAGLLDGCDGLSDLTAYDTRCHAGTAFVITVGDEMLAVTLFATNATRTLIEQAIDACTCVQLGDPRTMRDVVNSDAERAAPLFARSRAEYAAR